MKSFAQVETGLQKHQTLLFSASLSIMKRNKKIFILFLCVILYFIFSHFTHIYIPCPIHHFLGLWCPGCGITRMLRALCHLNFYQAFRYNQLLCLSFPFFLILLGNTIFCNAKGQIPLYKKIPNWVYYIYVVLLLLFMIIRNIFPYFAPVDI